jgi:hypothetical protein
MFLLIIKLIELIAKTIVLTQVKLQGQLTTTKFSKSVYFIFSFFRKISIISTNLELSFHNISISF